VYYFQYSGLTFECIDSANLFLVWKYMFRVPFTFQGRGIEFKVREAKTAVQMVLESDTPKIFPLFQCVLCRSRRAFVMSFVLINFRHCGKLLHTSP